MSSLVDNAIAVTQIKIKSTQNSLQQQQYYSLLYLQFYIYHTHILEKVQILSLNFFHDLVHE